MIPLTALLTLGSRSKWPLLLVSAIGWVMLILTADSMHPDPSAAHAMRGTDAVQSLTTTNHLHVQLAFWLAMLLAMSPPLLASQIDQLWRGSLRRRRLAVIAAFVSGYVTPWLVAGLAIGLAAASIAASAGGPLAMLAVATLWHCSPARQRCMNACHRPPRPRVFGAAAFGDAARFGAITGLYCSAACGFAMLLALSVPQYHLPIMVTVALLATIERQLPPRRPCWQLPLARGRLAREFQSPPFRPAAPDRGLGQGFMKPAVNSM